LKQIGVSMGYFAEALITEEDAYRALMMARPNLVNSEYGEALERIFLRLGKTLDRKGRQLRKLTREQLHAGLGGSKNDVLDLPNHFAPHLAAKVEQIEKTLKSA
jgi:hypothetical protein